MFPHCLHPATPYKLDTTSDFCPPLFRFGLHANNSRKTDTQPALLGDFSDPKEQLTVSKPTWPIEIDITVLSFNFWICNASRLPKTRNRREQDVCSSPKIKLRVKLRSLLTCSLYYIKTKQKKAASWRSGLFWQRDVKNSIFAGKFSLADGKNLASLKCLHK